MLRYALALCALAACLGALASNVTAEGDETMVSKTFDVSAITTPSAYVPGRPLGALIGYEGRTARASREDWPEPEAYLSGEELVDVLHAWSLPEVWDEEDAWIEYRNHRLAIHHRPAVVRELEALLYQLSAGASLRVLLHAEVREEGSGDGGCRISGSIELPPGVVKSLTVTSAVDYVSDYDVEIAQASNISNPNHDHLDEGLVVEAAAHPLVDGKRVLLDAYFQFCCLDAMRAVELGADEECIHKPWRSPERFPMGTVQLPSCSHADAHVSMIVSAGEDVLIPLVSGARRATLRLHVEILGTGGPDRLVGVSALTAPTLPLRAGEPANAEEYPSYHRSQRIRALGEEELGAFGSIDELVEILHRSLEPRRWEDGEERLDGTERHALRVTAGTDLVAKVRGFLQNLETETLRPVVLDVAVLSVRDTVVPGPGHDLDPELSTVVTSGRLHTLSGRPASIRLGTTTNYLVDYDVEVAQESRIPDPITGQSFGGLVGNVTPHLPLSGRTIRVDLDLLFSLDELATEPFDSGTQYLGPIEQVQARQTRIDTSIGVPLGGRTLLDAGPDPENPGARLVLAVSATTP